MTQNTFYRLIKTRYAVGRMIIEINRHFTAFPQLCY